MSSQHTMLLASSSLAPSMSSSLRVLLASARRRRLVPLCALALAAAILGPAPEAWACGGCFSPPPPQGGGALQTVVQDAERVLFMHDPDTKQSTVWVEVRYTGLAKDFGWVLPLPKVPKVAVGTSLVFDRLDERMAPRFEIKFKGTENCRNRREGCEPLPELTQDAWGYADAGAVAMDASQGGGVKAPGVEVLDHGQAGPYDFVVVKSDKAAPLMAWLSERGYAVPKKATGIIDSHLKKGDVFVAIKLSNGNGVNLIRPIALTMDDAEPCVPLRLTSIAAQEDMTVSVTVAGPGRAVPKNHLSVRLNPLRLNLLAQANNYPNLVAAAIDEAGGRAFVTEYSQPGAGLGTLFSDGKAWLASLSSAGNLRELATAMAAHGQPWLHADVAELFEKHLGLVKLLAPFKPTTPAQALGWLWSCGVVWGGGMEGFTCTPPGAAGGLDPDEAEKQTLATAPLVAGLKEGIIDPIHKVAIGLKGAAGVTRMLMRISPDEMDRDPVFGFNPSLPPVTNLMTVDRTVVCSTGWTPGDRTRLSVSGLQGSWVIQGAGLDANVALDPRFVGAPAALAIELLDETGGPVVIDPSQVALVDAAIQGALPGKPSLPSGMTLKKGVAWTPPPADAPVTHLDPWKQPGNCEPKPGWKDGQLPPGTEVSVGEDAGSGGGDVAADVKGEDVASLDGGARGADATGGSGGGSGGNGGGGDGGGCSAAGQGRAAGGAWLLALALSLVAIRRRPAAVGSAWGGREG